MKWCALFISALVSTTAVATTGSATELFGRTPSVEMTISHTATQNELARQLEAQGYGDVKLSSFSPTTLNPEPQLCQCGDDPQTTRVHEGWNGTAQKEGRLVRVRVIYSDAS